MKKWYQKYLEVYGRAYDASVCAPLLSGMRMRLGLLQSADPLVSISIIAYNEERHLTACLWAISDMQFDYPVEIIGTDNDSQDHTAEIFRQSGIPFYTERQHSCGHARQCGLTHARGKYHINIDADTLYPPHYVNKMVSVMEHDASIVAVNATWSYIPDEHHSPFAIRSYTLARDCYLWLQSIRRPELSVRGLVFAYRTVPAQRVGIRTHIIRGEDGALALSLKPFGRIAFIRRLSLVPVTGYGTIGHDVSIWQNMRTRALKAIRSFKRLFTSQQVYADREENLIK
ncbi:MAG: glycosyltransferase family 2 protein [Prevotellaceae bacterium]|nr:glycosyltransferase family 2 protein [Prevotellaceae bacterium]